ncbi:DUF1571 domain-containing protein [Neorhodopirellula lusitana]|uniref:DUF1571 domain-containing protein n=1 Tax=Neorhodopirellula lusitana TaxID=445327 RepID=UPI0038501C0F
MKNLDVRLLVIPLVGGVLVSVLAIGGGHFSAPVHALSEEVADVATVGEKRQPVPMSEMLELAQEALRQTVLNVDDYTARLIKQEQDRGGVLQPPSEAFIKVLTRHPRGKPGGPLKVYMRFDSPANIQGREVIWVENENDGKLQVREAGMIGSMMTVPLEPDSFLAMRGQRYPITELGLTRLLEKLIQRGGVDREDPDVQVFKTEGHVFDGRERTLLQIERSQPSGREGDFSLAELVLDRQKNLVVRFRSFGWPESEFDSPPIIESYEYRDLKINVGLTRDDFSTSNPDYTFAK